MIKKLNNKGFTLIELMATIAIIAILVSILAPVVGESREKANAATNAANLRGVESHLSTLLVTNPEVFDKDTEIVDDVLAELNDMINRSTTSLANARIKLTEAQNKVNSVPSFLQGFYQFAVNEALNLVSSLESAVISTTEYRDKYVYRRQYAYYAQDGVLTLNGMTIDAPTSKELDLGGLTLNEGVDMMVIVSDTEIVASYEGLDKRCFAVVAGEGTAVDLSTYEHDYVPGDNGTCAICGNNDNHSDLEQQFPIN